MYSSIEIIFELLDVVFVLFQGYFLQYYMGSFLKPRGKSRHMGWYLMVMYTVLRKGLDAIWPPSCGGIILLGKQAVSFMLLAALTLCFYRAFCSITLFLTVSFQAVRDISIYISIILLEKPADLVLALWQRWVGNEPGSEALKWVGAMNASVAGLQIFRIFFALLLMGVSLRKIVKDFQEKNCRMHKSELRFILIPALTGLMLCMLLRAVMVTAEQNATIFLYQKYPSLMLLLPGVLLLSLSSILQGVKSLQEIAGLNREKNNRMILEKQVEGMQEHMGELERVYSGVRSIKHDMKNTLGVISGLMAVSNGANGDTDTKELKTYLDDLMETMNQLDLPFHTGNAVVDALLHMKYHEALQSIPDLRLYIDQLLFPQDLPVRSYDIGIILGNALDNALEACIRLKKQEPKAEVFIRLISFQRGKLLFLRIENSFDGNLVRNPWSEFPLTAKKEKELHGIGLVNMKHVAESYGGTVDWDVADRVFILAVMLKLPAFD